MMQSETEMQAWASSFTELLEKGVGNNAGVEVNFDSEHQVYIPTVNILLKGATESLVFNYGFFTGADYRAIAAVLDNLDDLLGDGAYIQRGEKTQAVDHFHDAYNWLIAEARRGVDIQRYKGLGEMNPSQLWETTMDPDVRRMLQVTVDDAIGADQIFTTLMGDQVEPRREFIETNALSVVNLDV